ncbi:MAG: hypothetical protein FWD23_04190 [Oscillospiraceae bacterium]|nr:hypothetical protein [Oscillospiraceae bacterium]
MFDFKFNLAAIKILLILIIAVFFTPFFFVSCGEGDAGASFSGFEISAGKDIGQYHQEGTPFGFALVVLPAGLLILSFLTRRSAAIYNICRYLFFIAPIFDVFAVFIIWRAFGAVASRKLEAIPVIIGLKPGFALYIFFNAALFAMAVVNYFKGQK